MGQLMTDMGDEKPFQFLRRLRYYSSGAVDEKSMVKTPVICSSTDYGNDG